MPRTSTSHPLYVDGLSVGPGRLGLTICPGKKGDSIYGAAWERDLGIDLDAIRALGADAVVTLLETDELEALRAAHLGDEVRRNGMDWPHLAVRDLEAPDAETLADWRRDKTSDPLYLRGPVVQKAGPHLTAHREQLCHESATVRCSVEALCSVTVRSTEGLGCRVQKDERDSRNCPFALVSHLRDAVADVDVLSTVSSTYLAEGLPKIKRRVGSYQGEIMNR